MTDAAQPATRISAMPVNAVAGSDSPKQNVP